MFKVGDRVLAMWPVEIEWWYPGVICGSDGSELEIQYDDGDRATVGKRDVLPLKIDVGSRVWGRWQGGRAYYPGTITQKMGDAIHIAYDDGDQEWTTVSLVRIHEEDLPTSF
jgi:hypothetical protein